MDDPIIQQYEPEKTVIECGTIVARINGEGLGEVYVNGVLIKSVCKFSFECVAGEMPIATLEVASKEVWMEEKYVRQPT